jgi:hypothetical protein
MYFHPSHYVRENSYLGLGLPPVIRYNLKSSHSAKPVTADLTNNDSYIMCVHVNDLLLEKFICLAPNVHYLLV